MNKRETCLGTIQDVNGTTVSVAMTPDSVSGFVYIEGMGYRVGQIGSFVRVPVGFTDLFGIISQVGASARPQTLSDEDDFDSRWMTIQLIGESEQHGSFSRGLSQYPTIGDEVHLVTEKELSHIYGQPDKPYFVKLGHISNADSIPALVDINKLITRHSAIVGTTGSGKSTTVSSVMNAIADTQRYPSARVVMLDLHGEYGAALKDKANIFRIGAEQNNQTQFKNFYIPFWALSFDELCEICFGEFNNEKDRNLIMERVLKCKLQTLKKYPVKGLTADTLSADSPIPFNIHDLWHQLFIETFGTYYKDKGGEPLDNLAYETDANGKELKGNAAKGIAPSFKHVANVKDEEKINYLPSASKLNIGKQLLLLGSKLRIPRYSFIFNPGDWKPDSDGKTKQDLDVLFADWLGSTKPVSILDMSGIPNDILQTTIGALLRILYEALFWSRNLSQGARERPLLLVMEEAHIYLSDSNQSMASNVVQRVVKEGRKYGIGAMIVSQRPSEINQTILSQCGSFIALRLNNSADRSHITGAISDNLDGLTNMLPILKTGEAIILGEAVKLPMRTLIEAPPKDRRPDSQDPIVYDEVPEHDSLHPGGWGVKLEETPDYSELIEAWRAQNPRISKVRG